MMILRALSYSQIKHSQYLKKSMMILRALSYSQIKHSQYLKSHDDIKGPILLTDKA